MHKYEKITTFAQRLRLLTIKEKGYTMARPIRETPILFGEDARRFEKRMKNPPLVTKEGKKRIMKAYEIGMKMLKV